MASLTLCTLALASLASAAYAKDPVKWNEAKVIHAQYNGDRVGNSVASADMGGRGSGSVVQTVRGEFDFDAGDVIYTAEEWVTDRQMLSFAIGSPVQYSIDKKNFLIKLGDGKVRKLKLIGTYPKKKLPI